MKTTILQFLLQILHCAKRLNLHPSDLKQLLIATEDAKFAPGDYYFCGPPDFKIPANHSLLGQQQSQQVATLEPSGTSYPMPSMAPGTCIPHEAPAMEDMNLYHTSPFSLGLTSLEIPAPLTASEKHPNQTFKPMGPAGFYTMPEHKLQQLLPTFNPDVKTRHWIQPFDLPMIPAYSSDIEQLVTSMMPDIIKPVLQQDLTLPLYHGTAFVIPKPSSNKLSLIINLAAWNKSQHYEPPKFKLPSV